MASSLASLYTPNAPSAVRGPTAYALSAAAYTAIPATRFANRVEIQEAEGSANTGISIQFNDGSIATYAPADYPVVLEISRNQINGHGHFLAIPAQVGAAAQNYCQIKALAAGTTIEVLELP